MKMLFHLNLGPWCWICFINLIMFLCSKCELLLIRVWFCTSSLCLFCFKVVVYDCELIPWFEFGSSL